MKSISIILILLYFNMSAQEVDIRSTLIDGEFKLPNVIAPLDYEDDQIYLTNASRYCPVKDKVFIEHVRGKLSAFEQKRIAELFNANSEQLNGSKYSRLLKTQITSIAE